MIEIKLEWTKDLDMNAMFPAGSVLHVQITAYNHITFCA